MPTRAQRRNRGETGGAAAEPITTAEAKAHLRVDHSNDDTYIDSLIIAATDYTEDVTSNSLIEKTYDYWLDAFPVDDDEIIKIPNPPLISITSIKYFDDDDVEQTWSSAEYVVDTDCAWHGHVYPGRTYSWPTARDFRKSVHIEYVAGYESSTSPVTGDNVPMTLKQAMLILIAHWYENREQVIVGSTIANVPDAYDALIANSKVRAF